MRTVDFSKLDANGASNVPSGEISRLGGKRGQFGEILRRYALVLLTSTFLSAEALSLRSDKSNLWEAVGSSQERQQGTIKLSQVFERVISLEASPEEIKKIEWQADGHGLLRVNPHAQVIIDLTPSWSRYGTNCNENNTVLYEVHFPVGVGQFLLRAENQISLQAVKNMFLTMPSQNNFIGTYGFSNDLQTEETHNQIIKCEINIRLIPIKKSDGLVLPRYILRTGVLYNQGSSNHLSCVPSIIELNGESYTFQIELNVNRE